MTTDPSTLAARLYGNTAPETDSPAPQAPPTAAPAPEPPKPPVAAQEPRQAQPSVTVDDLVHAELDHGERIYSMGGQVLEDAAQYDGRILAGTFEPLEGQARVSNETADAEALAEGRRQTAALLHEWSVPVHEAQGIASELRDWHERLVKGSVPDAEQVEQDRERTTALLHREWGSRCAANLALARQAYESAARRMPWLRDLMEAGAGNSPQILRHFAAIGLRNARRAARGK